MNRYTSKNEAFRSAVGSHMCVACGYTSSNNWFKKPCPICAKENTRQYFKSKIELNRGYELIALQNRGMISALRFQPRYKLVVNDIEVGEYVGDSFYIEAGIKIVEDVKPINFIDDLSKLKINLFKALYQPDHTFKFYRRGSL